MGGRAIKAIICDWAGTTIDFGSRTPIIALQQVIQQFAKREVAEEIIRSQMGYAKREHIRLLFQQLGISASNSQVDAAMQQLTAKILSIAPTNSRLINGTLALQQFARSNNIKIGSNTGYNADMMQLIAAAAQKQGYQPDYTITSNQVQQGRPYPWGCYKIAERLGVFPMQRLVKIGDTITDVTEGLNAGMWTVAISASSALIGLSQAALRADPDRQKKIANARLALSNAGAHIIIPTIAAASLAIQAIETHICEFGPNPGKINVNLPQNEF